jgi:hypothetical protein
VTLFALLVYTAKKKAGMTYTVQSGDVVPWSDQVLSECSKPDCTQVDIKQGKWKEAVPGTLQPKAHSRCGGWLRRTNLSSITGAGGYRVLTDHEERKRKGKR